MTKYGYSLHCNIPGLDASVSIYKTADACNNAVQKTFSKGWSGYVANCEYISNNDKPNGYEITEEWNRVSF